MAVRGRWWWVLLGSVAACGEPDPGACTLDDAGFEGGCRDGDHEEDCVPGGGEHHPGETCEELGYTVVCPDWFLLFETEEDCPDEPPGTLE